MKQDLELAPDAPAANSPAVRWFSPGRLVDEGARYWRVAPGKIVLLWLVPPAVMAFGAALAACGIVVGKEAGKQAYLWFVQEDGVAETLQVACYAVSLLLTLLVMGREWRRGDRLMLALYAVLAAGLTFMVGEELSWGQRLVGWATPEAITAVNKQGETNLHNIEGVGATFKWVQMLAGAYGALLPWLVLRSERLAPWREQLYKVVPHFTLAVYFAPLFLWRVYRNIDALEPSKTFYLIVAEYNEVMELIFALGILLFLVLRLRRYRTASTGASGGHV